MKWSHGRQFLTAEQYAADPLPMWIADMDFRVAPPILDALQRELDMGVLGYGGTPESYREAVVYWQMRRFGFRVEPEWITQSPGVIAALNVAIQAFSQPGDYVLVQTPVYFHIHSDVVINGRRLLHAPLVEEDGRYRFDPAVFEAAIRPGTKLFILCNPHNPTGNVWTREELLTMAEICERNNILVISDEVHQDLIFSEDARHIPFAMLNNSTAHNSIVCTAPSKTFNIAGLSCANILIPNDQLRRAYQAQSERNGSFLKYNGNRRMRGGLSPWRAMDERNAGLRARQPAILCPSRQGAPSPLDSDTFEPCTWRGSIFVRSGCAPSNCKTSCCVKRGFGLTKVPSSVLRVRALCV